MYNHISFLSALVVLTSTVAANAQDYRGFYNPAPYNYGVTQPNYGTVLPYSAGSPCLTGNCYSSSTILPGITYPASPCSTSTCGSSARPLSPACVNGQCGHPQHQYNGIRQGGCVNGQCWQQPASIGQMPLGGNRSRFPWTPTDLSRPNYPTNYGSATSPYQSFPVQLNLTSYPPSSNSTIPLYSTPQTLRPGNSPYYN